VKLGVHSKPPKLFEAFTVNVLPVVGGEEADVNDVNASASGSFAVT
jgi:hypothetical protein